MEVNLIGIVKEIVRDDEDMIKISGKMVSDRTKSYGFLRTDMKNTKKQHKIIA